VWFAANISVLVGPERLYGLSGAILGVEINGGDVFLEADKTEIWNVAEEPKLPRKMKGKEINIDTYQSLIQEHIKTVRQCKITLFGRCDSGNIGIKRLSSTIFIWLCKKLLINFITLHSKNY